MIQIIDNVKHINVDQWETLISHSSTSSFFQTKSCYDFYKSLSFFDPFVIMFSVPTAIIGIVLSLLLTGKHFSVVAFIGVIMLVGIVVANAIVLVDYLKQLRERGMERDAAIVEAGRVRLRPILMTALATILAMFPLALGIGDGGEMDAPLAIVVIGGLLVSTLITLVLVPVVYSIFDDWGQKLGRRRMDVDAMAEETVEG